MIYSYEAKDDAGRTVTGSLEAQDTRAAASQVRNMGYFLMRLVPADGGGGGRGPRPGPGGTATMPRSDWDGYGRLRPPKMPPLTWLLAHLVYPVWSGISVRDLALFYRQFSAMINAGVPIYQCLTTLQLQTGNTVLRRYTHTISEKVLAGASLSEGMAQYPWVFTDFHRAMVVAGEISGRLDLMFMRLAAALEQEYALRQAIKRETFYPILVVHASILIAPGPIVQLIVKGSIGAYLAGVLPPLIGIYAAALILYVITRLGSQFRLAFDTFISLIPNIGGTVRMIAMARFCRALASLYAAGVALPRALALSAAAGGNAYLGRKVLRAVPAIESGQGITQALSATNAFPPMVISMIGTGETTGSLDETMDKVAEYYEQESVVRLHQTSVTLGVVVTILVGIQVGAGVISFYSGYFTNLTSGAE